jgi:hypothetical protein
MERKFPTLKKVSLVSHEGMCAFPPFPYIPSLIFLFFPQADNPSTTAVRLERTYHSLADPDLEVQRVEMVKGYKYGKTLVFSEITQHLFCFFKMTLIHTGAFLRC